MTRRKRRDSGAYNWKSIVERRNKLSCECSDCRAARAKSLKRDAMLSAYNDVGPLRIAWESTSERAALDEMEKAFNALWGTPSSAERYLSRSNAASPTWYGLDKINAGIMDLGRIENNKYNEGASSSMPISNSTDLTGVIKEIRRLHGEGVNLTGIENALNEMKATRKNEVVNMLKGLTGAAVFAKPTSRRFVLGVYDDCGKAHTIEGIAFKGAEYRHEDDDEKFIVRPTRVLLQERVGVWSGFTSMHDLYEKLDDNNIPYYINWYDN